MAVPNLKWARPNNNALHGSLGHTKRAKSAFHELDNGKIPTIHSRKNLHLGGEQSRIAPKAGQNMYDQALNPKKYNDIDARKRSQAELKERIKAKRSGGGSGSGSSPQVKNGSSFVSSGHQGLDKLRYMESRGAKPNEQMRRNALSGDMRRNFAEQGGMSRVGVSALRGAAVGGVAGGTVESMQGGDFWDGAKSGAFYGATGMAGVRATRQAVGAQSYIGKNGIMGTMKMNKENYGVGVKDLLLNQQNVGRAKDVINSTRKK